MPIKFVRCTIAIAAGLIAITGLSTAPAHAATLRGKVTAADRPVAEARVLIVETKQSTFTDANGAFTFEDVPIGVYHLQAVSRGLGSAVAELAVVDGDNDVALELSVSPHKESIIVTATRSGAGSAEVVQPANVLDGVAITEKMQPTLGEVLGQEPGVSQTFFGAGASRPIIRGLEGGRVRMLEHGVGTGDVSDSSPDHAVAIDPVLAEQIEVLRGASTLLYGSSAVGGVVNVIDRRVPEALPAHPLTGTLNFRLGSVADERMGAADLNGYLGNVAWHLDTAVRDTEDYGIPGSADVTGVAAVGTLPNSDLESRKLTGGLSHVWTGDGFVGASFTRFDTTYGVPGESGTAGGPRIEVEQNKVDLRGGFDGAFGPFNSASFSLAAADYRHRELEGAEVASIFDADYLESRLELHNGEGGRLRGTIGLQALERETTVTGEEAFLPNNSIDNVAIFALQRLRTGRLNWEFGLRFETQNNQIDDPAFDREFEGLSGSVGLLYRWGNAWGVGGAVSQSDRLPNNEELFSGGAHFATGSFEVGDSNLTDETARGVELTLRKRDGKLVTGSLNLFHTAFDDYIYLEQRRDGNGDPLEIDGLPAFDYAQADSVFYGYEAELLFGLLHAGSTDLDLILRSDQTIAELKGTNEALPRIPPRRYSIGFDYRGPRFSATVEVLRRNAVTGGAVAPSATPTADSTVVSASVSRRFVGKGVVHTVMLRGSNLTDETVRLNTSRLKDRVPLPGADVSLIYRLQF